MTWEALNTTAQLGSTIAVFITLIYIAIQVRIINQQRRLNAFRHTYDSLNLFCDKMAQSKEIASIVQRGRISLDELDQDEMIILQHVHLRLLNSVESWYMQVIQTSTKKEYQEQQINNIAGVIAYYFGHPGSKEVWGYVKHTFEPIQDLVESNIT